MPATYLEPTGIVVQPSSLVLPRAKALVEAVGGRDLPFVQFVECRQFTIAGGQVAETVVFDVEVERPQRPANDLHRIERIAVSFAPADAFYPEVLALRGDFPHVPHTNVRRTTEYPRSLCLYDQPWEHISLRLTAAALVERNRFMSSHEKFPIRRRGWSLAAPGQRPVRLHLCHRFRALFSPQLA